MDGKVNNVILIQTTVLEPIVVIQVILYWVRVSMVTVLIHAIVLVMLKNYLKSKILD